LALARAGADIAALDVARQLDYPGYQLGATDDLYTLQAAISGLGRRALIFSADVRDEQAVAQAVQQTVAELGRIDILFNNAGIAAYGLAHELSEAAWDAVLDINLKGAWLVAKHIIPTLIAQHSGVIINNSSVAGLRGFGRMSHYTASKWGLTGLTKSLAIELAPHGVRVNSIHPTGVNTPMNDGLAALEGTTPEAIAERSAGNLLPVPWVEPQDVVEAVLFLASDRARLITGTQLVIDAGLLTR
ncbi:MAG: mycofactocin-coupled SDR family oxidoreductase, partial [Oscillochloris sp.]|nr:mycofactocin-coupled SDR family oxidoreductase [Oscillochloris sp.]